MSGFGTSRVTSRANPPRSVTISAPRPAATILRSAPAQKTGPVPVITPAATSRSGSRSSSAASMACDTSSLMALRASGRFSLRTSTCPRRSRSTTATLLTSFRSWRPRRRQLGDGREAREAAEIREADEEDRHDAETQRRSERVQPEDDRQRADTTEQHSAVTEALRQDAEHQRHRDRADALGGDERRGAAALVMEQLERNGRNECDERRGEQRVEREVTQQGA